MKIICSKSSLLNGVQIVYKAVPSKTTMPILECILISAKDDSIKLTANDMELGIETIIEGDIIEKGIVALDAKMLFEIVRKLPDNNVVIETSRKIYYTVDISITSDNANQHIQSIMKLVLEYDGYAPISNIQYDEKNNAKAQWRSPCR